MSRIDTSFPARFKAGCKGAIGCKCVCCTEARESEGFYQYREGVTRRILENEQAIRQAELKLLDLNELRLYEKQQEKRLRELREALYQLAQQAAEERFKAHAFAQGIQGQPAA